MSRVATIPLRKIIRMSERYVSPKHEYKVREVMKSVETNLRRWPGLLSIETLVDTEEANKYVVITEVYIYVLLCCLFIEYCYHILLLLIIK